MYQTRGEFEKFELLGEISTKIKNISNLKCAVIATLKSSLLTCNKVLQTIGLKLFLSRIDTVSFFLLQTPYTDKEKWIPNFSLYGEVGNGIICILSLPVVVRDLNFSLF